MVIYVYVASSLETNYNTSCIRFDCFLCRIRSITFKFSLATVYQEYDVEDYNSVDAKFFITVSLKNIMHGSSMSVDVTFHRDPQLRRQCRSFRKKSTIVDIIVMTLLILSSWTYIMSIIKSIKLAKVCMYSLMSQQYAYSLDNLNAVLTL